MDYPSDPDARLDPSTGKFTDGNPATDLPASRDSAYYQNMVFDSLINLIEGAGLTPDENDLTLVLQAVASLAGNRQLGEPFWHIGETPPNGAMEYAGQILNRSEYPELWSYIDNPANNFKIITQAQAATRTGCWHTGDGSGTFGVPVFSGDFIRVWDSTGLIDTGRVLGSFQSDELKSHTHDVYGVSKKINGPHTDSTISTNWSATQSSLATGGAETRPRNTALMLCFWYQ